MTDDEFDAFIARAQAPHLIRGIYNYCDRRCTHCRLRHRCLQFSEAVRSGELDSTGAPIHDTDPAATVARVVLHSLDRAGEMLRIAAERMGLAADALSDADGDSKDDPQFQPYDDARDRAAEDPLYLETREYADLALPILDALVPLLAARGDARASAAVDHASSVALSIMSKTYRALIGLYEPDYDPDEVSSDANGSAKVARLVIADSCVSWEVLMEEGRASADGVPAQLVRRLRAIDAKLAARFPRAMQFQRPGFDDPLSEVPPVARQTEVAP